MNRALKAVEVATPAPILSPLELARADYAAIASKLAAIAATITDLQNPSLPAEPGPDPQTIFQKLGRLLKGTGGKSTPETDAAERELENAKRADLRASALRAANDSEISTLRARETALIAERAVAQRAIRMAAFEAASAEFERELIPELRAAADHYRRVYGKVAGAGQAHHEMARVLREQDGIAVQAMGTDRPVGIITLNPVGLGIADGGAFNTLRLDATVPIENGRNEHLQKWVSN